MTRQRIALAAVVLLVTASGIIGTVLYLGERRVIVGKGWGALSVTLQGMVVRQGSGTRELPNDARRYPDLSEWVLAETDDRIARRIEETHPFVEIDGGAWSILHERAGALSTTPWGVRVERRRGFPGRGSSWASAESPSDVELAERIDDSIRTILEEEFAAAKEEIEREIADHRECIQALVRLRGRLEARGAPASLRDRPIDPSTAIWPERVRVLEELHEEWVAWLEAHPEPVPRPPVTVAGSVGTAVAEGWREWAAAVVAREPDLRFTLNGGFTGLSVTIDSPAGSETFVVPENRPEPRVTVADLCRVGDAAVAALGPREIRTLVGERVRALTEDEFAGLIPVRLTAGSLDERLAVLDAIESALASVSPPTWFAATPFAEVRVVAARPTRNPWPRWVDAKGFPPPWWGKRLEIPVGTPVGPIRVELTSPTLLDP